MSSQSADRPEPEALEPNGTEGAPRPRPAKRGKLLLLEKFYRHIPLPPVWTAVLFATVTVVSLTLIEIITGRMSVILSAGAFDPYGYFFTVVHLILLGYTPTAVVVVVHAARRNAQSLIPLLEPSDAALALQARVGQYRRAPLFIAGLIGAAIGFVAPTLDTAVWLTHTVQPYAFDLMSPEIIAQRFLSPLFGFFSTQLLYVAAVEAWRFNRLARHVKQSELLERRTLDPFARQGLTNVLIVAIFPTILLFFTTNQGLALVIGSINALAVAFAVAGLLGPLLGIHGRVATAKQEQMEWLSGELAKERAVLKGGKGNRFVALMAYRSYIESVQEWPLDGTTLTRLALYLAIPLFSWVGSAVVARIVDTALG